MNTYYLEDSELKQVTELLGEEIYTENVGYGEMANILNEDCDSKTLQEFEESCHAGYFYKYYSQIRFKLLDRRGDIHEFSIKNNKVEMI